jgi:hypothetical protein
MMSEEFAGPNCRRQSVIYPDVTQDRGRVVCRTCSAFLRHALTFRRFGVRQGPGQIRAVGQPAPLRLDSNAPRPCLDRRFQVFRVGVSSAAPGPETPASRRRRPAGP